MDFRRLMLFVLIVSGYPEIVKTETQSSFPGFPKDPSHSQNLKIVADHKESKF